MVKMTACHLCQFSECGLSTHIPHISDEPRKRMREFVNDLYEENSYWSPIGVQRPDGTFGYLKCTMRHVQLMRHWTELFYTVLVQQAHFTDFKRAQYKWDSFDQWRKRWEAMYNAQRHDLFDDQEYRMVTNWDPDAYMRNR